MSESCLGTPDYAVPARYPDGMSDCIIRHCANCGHVIWRRPQDMEWTHAAPGAHGERATAVRRMAYLREREQGA